MCCSSIDRKQTKHSNLPAIFVHNHTANFTHAKQAVQRVILQRLRPTAFPCTRPMSQNTAAYPGRSIYASSSKLPDRPAQKTGTTVPSQQYTQSNVGRRPEQSYQFAQSTVPQQQHGQGGRQTMEKETNALAELTEEQRDEINEAVRGLVPLATLSANLETVLSIRP
jgi:hypothetical protein